MLICILFYPLKLPTIFFHHIANIFFLPLKNVKFCWKKIRFSAPQHAQLANVAVNCIHAFNNALKSQIDAIGKKSFVFH